MKTRAPLRLLRFVLPVIVLIFPAVFLSHHKVLAGVEEWRPVDPADLALKAPVVEPDADAEALFWDIRIDDAGANDLVLQHYIRIKIFNERGREKQSKIDIPFFSNTKIKDIAARTVKPDGSIVELPKDDFLERTIVKTNGVKLRSKSFAFPATEVGSIIEYKWKEVISDASANNMRLQFQREIPVHNITYHIKPMNSSSYFEVRAFNMVKPDFEKEKNGFQYAAAAKVPAFHEEPMMPPEDNVRAWAIVRYRSLVSMLLGYDLMAIQYYNGSKEWLKVDNEIKRKAAEIVGDSSTPEDKLDKIFTFCRTSIKNTYEKSSGFTSDELAKLKENKKPADTLKRGVGPPIDIDLLFAALVNASGMQARLALTPDRGRYFFDRNVMVPGVLKPANIAVRFGDTWKFYDPGFHYITPGMLRWQEEGVDALICDESPTWVKTPLSTPDKSREKRIGKFTLDENGTLEGDVTIEYSGHLAVDKKALNDDDSPEQREQTLKDGVKRRLSTAEVSNIMLENVMDPVKPFIYKYHVRVPDYAQRTGKRLFLQPAYFEKGLAALFETNTRRYPIYFHYPWSEEDQVTIALPKGYALDNADSPPPLTGGAVSKYEVTMGVTKDEGTLVYKRNFFFGGNGVILIPADRYKAVKNLFDELNKADNHTITLKQKVATN